MRPSSAVQEYLESRELDYAVGQEYGHPVWTFHIRARGNTCTIVVRVTAADAQSALRVGVLGGARSTMDTHSEVQRLLRWANQDDPLGMFSAHPTHGEVCYAVAADVTSEVTPTAIGRIAELAAARFDRLYPALTSIIWAGGKAGDLIPVTETPAWGPLMESVRDDLAGLVPTKPLPTIPNRALSVSHMRLLAKSAGTPLAH